MLATQAPLWTKAPALRLLIPFILGIVVQWYLPLPLAILVVGIVLLILLALLYQLVPITARFSFRLLHGVLLSLLIALIGAGAVYSHDIRNNKEWIGHVAFDEAALVVELQEPLVEKPNSYKAVARVQQVYNKGVSVPAEGKVIIYFKKDSLAPILHYGSRLITAKSLQPIRNTGNPGSFDYQRYSLFSGITHQVYLTPDDFDVLPAKAPNQLHAFLYRSRSAINSVLQKFIKGEKELGLAEALLIGYKDDLDKSLLQSYSNTGVVHVIAISGLHVGLIYWLLLGLTRSLKRRRTQWLRIAVLLAALWGFGLLAGAAASVMRSVVMFSFLAFSEVLNRRSSVYNTFSLSAFLLLCYNPFWLWDIGFQLSYAAVLSILIFYGPISRWIVFPNKGVDLVWKMIALTLSAQIFTTPISLYHFHQFPNLFLLTNLVAVPLSSLILFGEILLCALAFLPAVASVIGTVLNGLIRYMNEYVESMDQVSFAVWSGISINAGQTILLLIAISTLAYWMMEGVKRALPIATVCLLTFIVLRTFSFLEASKQRKLIVYNVPKHKAIDVIEGRQYRFIGDAAVEQNLLLRNYHLQPSRILHRASAVGHIQDLTSFTWNQQQIVIIDSTIQLKKEAVSKPIDLLILSGNPKVYITNLSSTFRIKRIVADASVPRWKALLWKRDCDSLRIPFYDVQEKGAFVMNL